MRSRRFSTNHRMVGHIPSDTFRISSNGLLHTIGCFLFTLPMCRVAKCAPHDDLLVSRTTDPLRCAQLPFGVAHHPYLVMRESLRPDALLHGARALLTRIRAIKRCASRKNMMRIIESFEAHQKRTRRATQSILSSDIPQPTFLNELGGITSDHCPRLDIFRHDCSCSNNSTRSNRHAL